METSTVGTPNKSRRLRKPRDISLAIIHYTGNVNGDRAVRWMQDPVSQVSAHWVIDRNGFAWKFETHLHRLWHAGESQWRGKNDCNSFSIGYELAGTYDSGFTELQYNRLINLLDIACVDFPIQDIVGHEQVAPGRKIDPGPNFSWSRLHKEVYGGTWPCHIRTLGPDMADVAHQARVSDMPDGELEAMKESPPALPMGRTKSDLTLWQRLFRWL